jgi:phosphatidylglycerol---prolipoprotein diacylglyceryl transferase
MIHWNVDPIIFSAGFIQLRWYSLGFLLGFSLGYHIMRKICLWEGKSTEQLDSLLVHLVAGTTIGARLGHCLFYDPGYYLTHPLEILKIWEGGLASHGGVLGVIIAVWLFRRKNPEFGLMWLFDRLIVPTVMTGGFIRLGNLMNSEILGKPTEGNWGVVFDRVDQFPRHPAMVYESICYFVIFAISYRMYLRFKEKTPPGMLFGFVMAAVFACRLVIEFFKENQSAFENEMTFNMGQLLSVPFIIVGLFFFFRSKNAEVSAEMSRQRKR